MLNESTSRVMRIDLSCPKQAFDEEGQMMQFYDYASERFGSIRFRFGFCHTGFKPARNRTGAGSVRFGSIPGRFGTEDKEYKKLLI
jgi:hypothetical protein